MILTIVILLSALIIGIFGALFAVKLYVDRQKRAFTSILQSYFEAPDSETPSQFALVTEAISERFAQKLVASLKSSFMGMQSVDAKNMARLEGDVMQDVAGQQNPMLGAILSSFPAVSKRLAKNPALYPLVQAAMAKLATGAGGATGKSVGNGGGDYTNQLNLFGR